MKEELIIQLMNRCGIRDQIRKIEPVSGGLMHRMYKVEIEGGNYAVKHLNPNIMKRPDALANYARAEKLEETLQAYDIPIVPAMVIDGKRMQKIQDEYFYLFRWQEGEITDWKHIEEDMCFQIGTILGKIHAIEPKEGENQSFAISRTDWRDYILKAKEENIPIASLLEENEDLLCYAQNELNRARALLPAIMCISDEDMDPKNIMWDKGIPWVIDLECLDYGNPVSHVLQLALQWSGIIIGDFDVNKMNAFFKGYLQAYDNGFRNYSDITGVAYTWIEWLEYNMQRALGACTDEKECELGISEVKSTMERIRYIREIEFELKTALQMIVE